MKFISTLLVFFASSIFAKPITDADWEVVQSAIPGTDGIVEDMIIDNQGNLIVSGNFRQAGLVFARSVAQWDGQNWSALGDGFGSTDIHFWPNYHIPHLFLSPSHDLYMTTSDEVVSWKFDIRKWLGSTWSIIDAGIQYGSNRRIDEIQYTESGILYASGNFSMIPNGESESQIAMSKDHGTTWISIATVAGKHPFAICPDQSLVTVGDFTTIGADSVVANSVARWTGSEWQALGSGITAQESENIFAIACDSQNNPYIGGEKILKHWNGSVWNTIGSSQDTLTIKTMKLDAEGDLLVGGRFTQIGDVRNGSLAQWNGSQWEVPNQSPEGTVLTIAVRGDTVYAGGNFTHVGNQSAGGVVKWNSQTNEVTGFGGGAPTRSVQIFTGDNKGQLFTAGIVGDHTAIHLFNGTAWSALPTPAPLTQISDAIFDANQKIWITGSFLTSAPNQWLNQRKVMQWNGSQWEAIGDSLGTQSGSAFGLELSPQNEVYAFGDFVNKNSKALQYLVKWNGTEWEQVTLPSKMGAVYAICFSPSGQLTVAGKTINSKYSHIARFDGSQWNILDTNATGYTFYKTGGSTIYSMSMAYSGDGSLHVIGDFTTPKNGMAIWNDSTWKATPFTNKINTNNNDGAIHSIQGDLEGNLYLGGNFYITNPQGKVLSLDLARWNKSLQDFEPIGSASTPAVYSIWLDKKNTLWAAGDFLQVGNAKSPFIAKVKTMESDVSFTLGTNSTLEYGSAPFPITVVQSIAGPLLFTSSNPQVATIDAQGEITIVGTGSTDITVALQGGTPEQKMTRTLTITPKPIMISGISLTNMVYDAGLDAVCVGSPILQNVIPVDQNDVEIQGTLLCHREKSQVSKSVIVQGSGLTLIGARSANYILQLNHLGSIEVTKATATLRALDTTRFVNEENPSFSFAVQGLLGADIPQEITQVSYSVSATKQSPEGRYLITIVSAYSDNYQFEYQPGTLTILASTSIHKMKSSDLQRANKAHSLYDLLGRTIHSKTIAKIH